MASTFGKKVQLSLFGESHGPAIGAVLDGMPSGISIDREKIEKNLSLRRGLDSISTTRRESDQYQFLSGIYNNKTTGAPITIIIENEDINSKDYRKFESIPRPSHADYTAIKKYGQYRDPRGGGYFSGRITAALVTAGSICEMALDTVDIEIGTHIKQLGPIKDQSFKNLKEEIRFLKEAEFPTLDGDIEVQMIEEIIQIKRDKDSLGGLLETAVIGLPAGIGEPWFDKLESVLSHSLFAIPSVKGVAFGAGFDFANMKGSEANDSLEIKDGEVHFKSNYSGGVNGGISNGMPIIFSCAIRPTPSIGKAQDTVDLNTLENTTLEIKGRHDPSIVPRVKQVVDSMTAFVLCDFLSRRYGDCWNKGAWRFSD